MLFDIELFIVYTRGNLKVANHQSDPSQSEQVLVGSHMKSPISFGRMNKRLPKGNSLFE